MPKGTENFRRFQISGKRDNLERLTKTSVPFHFVPVFFGNLVEWIAPIITSISALVRLSFRLRSEHVAWIFSIHSVDLLFQVTVIVILRWKSLRTHICIHSVDSLFEIVKVGVCQFTVSILHSKDTSIVMM